METSRVRPSFPTYGVVGTVTGAPVRVRLAYSAVTEASHIPDSSAGQGAGPPVSGVGGGRGEPMDVTLPTVRIGGGARIRSPYATMAARPRGPVSGGRARGVVGAEPGRWTRDDIVTR